MQKSERKIKVYEAPLGYGGKQQTPRIQLQGQWLENFGFHCGDAIEVKCYENAILITKPTTK